MKIYVVAFILLLVVGAFGVTYYTAYNNGYDKATLEMTQRVNEVAAALQKEMAREQQKSREAISQLELAQKEKKKIEDQQIRDKLATNKDFSDYYNTTVHPDAVDIIYGASGVH
ncbi:MAG: hypothetical protein OEZ39_04085 [Gammaproteobacteria bacterium]|nr:hypothetical protein [Gammaproteobacteria bacterium]MDH5651037.1 hypothetical protein [Gammaproteobacteria bacterium]